MASAELRQEGGLSARKFGCYDQVGRSGEIVFVTSVVLAAAGASVAHLFFSALMWTCFVAETLSGSAFSRRKAGRSLLGLGLRGSRSTWRSIVPPFSVPVGCLGDCGLRILQRTFRWRDITDGLQLL